jgi:hypothetical protein
MPIALAGETGADENGEWGGRWMAIRESFRIDDVLLMNGPVEGSGFPPIR